MNATLRWRHSGTARQRRRGTASPSTGWDKAAEQGVRKAQYNLGVLLSGQAREGGGATDIVEGWMWLALAAESGVADAAAARDGVAKRMSVADKAEARRRLDARKARNP